MVTDRRPLRPGKTSGVFISIGMRGEHGILQEFQCRARQQTSNNAASAARTWAGEEKQKVRYWWRPATGRKAASGSPLSIADVDPYSIEDARAVMAKREVQKKEKVPLFRNAAAGAVPWCDGKWYLRLSRSGAFILCQSQDSLNILTPKSAPA